MRLLILALIALSLTACGKDNPQSFSQTNKALTANKAYHDNCGQDLYFHYEPGSTDLYLSYQSTDGVNFETIYMPGQCYSLENYPPQANL